MRQVFACVPDDDLAEVVALVSSGAFSVRIGTVLTFADAAEAHRIVESGTSTGKVVLVPPT